MNSYQRNNHFQSKDSELQVKIQQPDNVPKQDLMHKIGLQIYQFKDEQNKANRIKQIVAGLTNNILLIHNLSTKFQNHQATYYIPVYNRVILNNIVSLDFQKLAGLVNVIIQLSVYYGPLQQHSVKQLEQNMILSFPNTSSIKLNDKKDSQLKVSRINDYNKKCFHFTIKALVDVLIINKFLWAPFQIANLVLSMSIRKIIKMHNNKICYKYEFNFMDINDDLKKKFDNKANKNFGIYSIADKKLSVQYSSMFSLPFEHLEQTQRYIILKQQQQENQQKIQNQDSQIQLSQKDKVFRQEAISDISAQSNIRKALDHFVVEPQTYEGYSVQNFNTAHYNIFLYKNPITAILKTLVPVVLLGAISIGVIYQDNNSIGKKIINMSAILVAYISLISSIRQNFITSKGITFSDLIILTQGFIIVMSFIQALAYSHNKQKKDSLSDSSIGIFCITIVSITGLVILIRTVYFIYQIYYQYIYQKNSTKKEQMINYSIKNIKQWKNIPCDIQFMNSSQFRNHKIKILKKFDQIQKNKTDLSNGLSLINKTK